MKAAVVYEANRPLILEDRLEPVAGPRDVVVKVEACGLCHTDIAVARGDWPVKPRLPLVLGHEVVGRIETLGAGVSHLRIGDRVAVPWLGWACGRCRYCLSGSEALCPERRNTGFDTDGGFAEYIRVAADFVVQVPRSIDPLDAACLTCAGLSAYKAVKTSGARSANLTAVFGIGGLGHMALQYARIAGAAVVAVDTVEDKLTMAKDLGAGCTVNAAETDAGAAIQDLGGADQAIIAAGSATAVEQGLASLRPGGTLVLLSVPADNTLHVPIYETISHGITVIGSIGGSRVDLAEVFALHAHGHTRAVYQARRLAQVNQAIAEVEAHKAPARLVFEFR